uniref:Peroxin-7 n=1 Tax=Blastobotrys adeninivorans TaxID=409370 RepID=A0A060T083_BLAAD
MLSFKTAGFSGYGVQYSPFFDSKIAVASAANFGLVGNGRLYVLDIGADGMIRPQSQFDTQDGLFDLAWSEIHENQIVTANGDGTIKLFDITTAQPYPIKVFQEHTKEVFSVNWNLTDKNLFVSSSWDGTIKVWNPMSQGSVLSINAPATAPPRTQPIPTSQNKAHQQPNPNCIYTVNFSPHNGTMLASAHSDSSVRLFDIRSGPNPTSLIPDAHLGGECLSLDWNKYRPTVLATSGVDKAVKIWDIRNLRSPINDLRAHEYAVRKVSWSPHSQEILLSVSYDTTAFVWNDTTVSGQPFIPTAHHTKGLMTSFDKHSEFVVGCDWSLFGQPGWVATVGWDEMLYVWKAV